MKIDFNKTAAAILYDIYFFGLNVKDLDLLTSRELKILLKLRDDGWLKFENGTAYITKKGLYNISCHQYE